MGHHIDAAGCFQSDKHPELPPDKVLISFEDPFARAALAALALAVHVAEVRIEPPDLENYQKGIDHDDDRED